MALRMVRFWEFCSATDRLRQRMIGRLLMRSRRGRPFVAFRIRRSSGLCFGLRSLWWPGKNKGKSLSQRSLRTAADDAEKSLSCWSFSTT